MEDGRQAQRKAETRGRIIRAANELFLERGYAGTSMEDIATAANVAIRTIYLHFESKAAILLDYFDVWLDEFVRLIGQRTAGEQLDETLARTLRAMTESEQWDDNKRVEDVTVLHPVIEFIGAGAPEISGHIMQRWVDAQDRLTESFRVAAGLATDDPRPRIEAAAVFAIWMTSVLEFRARFGQGLGGPSTHDIGGLAVRAYVDGFGASH